LLSMMRRFLFFWMLGKRTRGVVDFDDLCCELWVLDDGPSSIACAAVRFHLRRQFRTPTACRRAGIIDRLARPGGALVDGRTIVVGDRSDLRFPPRRPETYDAFRVS
jgi:hypothetical protein